MGTYLSTPVTDKCEESGESLECPDVPCSWGVVDMQGWRKSMEDAHIAVTDIPLPLEGDNPEPPTSDAKVFGVFDGHGGPEVARFTSLYLVSVLTQQTTWKEGVPTNPEGDNPNLSKVGVALRAAFHALDRMIDDPSRRDELIGLRNMKPTTGERRDAVSIPEVEQVAPSKTSTDAESNTQAESTDAEKTAEASSTEDGNKNDEDKKTASTEAQEGTREESNSDDDSNEAVGKEEAAEKDQDMMDEEGADSKTGTVEGDVDPANAKKVSTMFQKILSLGGQSGQVAINVDDGSGEGSENSTGETKTLASQVGSAAAPVPMGPSASQPSIMNNGRMICNLPDHPIHAGATAIVAVITGRTLTVANAGDSRAVLCRSGGVTLPLSFDHKPQQDREMNRITKAGGFVNHFGRVNGNLNLSRSIGDLKYKQVPGIAPPDQIITAEPDITQVALEENDEFIILGCDGIWDCLTNENAVEYVRERIDTKTPVEIGKEMLDEIISEDPRVTQGIGGDNMTVMVIDLQPQSRKRQSSPEASE